MIEEYNELIKIENAQEPQEFVFYHYTSPAGLLGIMDKGGREKLRFTQFDSLNDRSERENMYEYLYGYCDFQVKHNNLSLSFCNFVKSIILNDEGDFIEMDKELSHYAHAYKDGFYTYLCCFSKNSDSLAMWNYYSKSKHYEGYAIGMMKHEFPIDTTHGYKLSFKNVIYADQEKARIMDRLVLPLNKKFENDDPGQRQELATFIQDICYTLQFVFKNSCFAHEEEIRAILEVPQRYEKTGVNWYGDPSLKLISERMYREKDGYIIPFVELTLPNACAREIIVAPLLEKELSMRNLKNMLSNYGYSHVGIRPSQIPIRY